MHVTKFRLAPLMAAHDPPLTQAELAHRANVHIATVSRIYHNKTAQVSLGTLGKLAVVLGCAPGDLIVTEAAAVTAGARSSGQRRSRSKRSKRGQVSE